MILVCLFAIYSYGQIWQIGSPDQPMLLRHLTIVRSLSVELGRCKIFYIHTMLPWYRVKDGITNVIINNGVTTIGNSTFLDCISLTWVTIPYTPWHKNCGLLQT